MIHTKSHRASIDVRNMTRRNRSHCNKTRSNCHPVSTKFSYKSAIQKFKPETKVRLIYFPEFRARSEAILLMCAYRNVAVEQLPPDAVLKTEWPAGRKLTPFSQLPVLILDDGTGLAQSYAIQKYLAKKFKLVSDNHIEEAFADQTAQTGEELGRINPICNDLTGAEFKAAVKDFFEGNEDDGPNANTKLANLSRSLGSRAFFPGASNEPSFGDFTVLHYFQQILLVDNKKFNKFPNLKSWIKRMESLPGVKEYLASRPRFMGVGHAPKLV